jgi:lipopolysaccharide export system permease protein
MLAAWIMMNFSQSWLNSLITILDRYIFRELLSPFFLSLFALSFIMFTKEMLRLVELLVNKGIGLYAVLKIIAHLMPSFLVLTLPMACLIASITAFSRLSFDKELVALRAAGMSLLRISLPVMVFSVLVFVLTLVLSQWGQPWTNLSLKKLALTLIEDRLSLALDHGVFNEPMPNLLVYIPEPNQSHESRGVFISDKRNQAKPLIIIADTFRILNDPQQTQLGLRLFNGHIHQPPESIDEYHQVAFSTYDIKMSISSPIQTTIDDRPTLPDMMKKLEESNWRDSGTLRRLMEYYKDLAFPIASLLLGILGVPIGIVSNRSSRMGGFVIGILVIVAYYLLNVVGEFLVTTLFLHPFAGAWLPNFVLLSSTLILFYQKSRC